MFTIAKTYALNKVKGTKTQNLGRRECADRKKDWVSLGERLCRLTPPQNMLS